MAFFALATLGSLGGFNSRNFGGALLVVVICGALLAAGVMWLRSLKPTYHVFLASASGERQGLSSQDANLVDQVIDAITSAITHRG